MTIHWRAPSSVITIAIVTAMLSTVAGAQPSTEESVPVIAHDEEPTTDPDDNPGDDGNPGGCVTVVEVEDDFATPVVRVDSSGTDTLEIAVEATESLLEIVNTITISILPGISFSPNIDTTIDRTRRFSETGVWLALECPVWVSAPTDEDPGAGYYTYVRTNFSNGQPIVPASEEVILATLISDAAESLDPPKPGVFTSPDSDLVTVHIPTWFWIENGYWQPYRQRATAGRVWVEAIATPVFVIWDTDDSAGFICDGPGSPWHPGADPEADCTYGFEHSSATQPDNDHDLTGIVVFDLTWESNVPNLDAVHPNRFIGRITRSGGSTLTVGEIQALAS